VFYDVGAGLGFYSLLAARLGAQVLAFEPDSKNASCLRHHARLNSLESNIEIHDAAVLARNGNTQLRVASQEKGHGNSQIVGALGSEKKTVTVACISLNEVAKTKVLPTLIKVDVEGSESDVLRGAEQVFERCRPDVICEIHDATNEEFVVDWLNRRGYSLEWIKNQNSAEFPRHLIANPKE
jgi:FkbM family methyltransferase